MMDIPTPKQKLAGSRAALLAEMGFEYVDAQAEQALANGFDAPLDPDLDPSMRPADETVRIAPLRPRAALASEAQPRPGIADRLRHSALGRWWRRSDLRYVPETVVPVIDRYAQTHPGKLVLFSAAAGSLLVLVKPWRLLSIGTVAGLLIKSTQFSALAMDLLTQRDDPRDADPSTTHLS